MATSRITGTNEDPKSYKTAGGDYSDLTTWEEATDINCVTGTTSPVLEIYSHATGHHDDMVACNGATVNATYFRIIRAASGEGHAGIPKADGSVASFNSTTTTTGNLFGLEENYFSLQDIVIIWGSSSATYDYGVFIDTVTNCSVVGVLCKCTNAGAGTNYGFRDVAGSANTIWINCLAYECDGKGMYIKSASYIYNCTGAFNVIDNFDDNGNQATWKNCLAWGGSSSLDYETIGTSVTCGDEDGTGDFTLTGEPFVDSANDDYHLGVGQDGIGDGTDVSGDGYGDDDVDKQTRVAWDVGFDEYIAVGANAPTGALYGPLFGPLGGPI